MKRFLSILLATVMFLSLFATITFAEGESLEDIIDDKIDELCCFSHGKLDLVFGTSGTVCPEDLTGTEPGTRGLEVTLSEIFGYPATMENADLLAVRAAYSGLGNGQTAWPEATVTFSDPESDEEYEVDIDLAMYKSVTGSYCGAITDKGFLGICPEDWPANAKAGLKAIAARPASLFGDPGLIDDDQVFELPGEEITAAAVEAWYRDLTKLGDGWTFYCSDLKAAASQAVSVALINHDIDGRTAIVSCSPTLEVEPLEYKIDDKLDELVCFAHGKLDIIFGESKKITPESLGAILTELFGYPATVEQSEVDRIKATYGGLGGGQTAWVDGVEVTFSKPATGEEYDTEIDLSVFKSLYGQHAGALDEEHPAYYGTCPDDWPAAAKAAMTKVSSWDDETKILMEGVKVYTLESVEAWYREVTGLGEGWTFCCNWFDATKAFTGNEVALALMNNDVNGEGRTMIVACGPVIHIAEPTASLEDEIDELYDKLVCVAHGKLDIVCGTSSTIYDPDNGTRGLETALTEIFGYPATMSDEDLLYVKEDYQGLGDGQTAWPAAVTVTFSNPNSSETYDLEVDLSLYKSVGGSYCGAIVDHGFLGACPDDWSSEAKAAKASVNNATATAPDLWDDDDVFVIPGEEYTPAAIESWLRGVTKLGDAWTFYINGFNADEAYTGNTVSLGLVNKDFEGKGRMISITCGPTLKIEQKPTVSFVDVPEGEYYYDAVAWAVANNITNGTDATHFSPKAGCTRAQVVTFLWRSAGEPEPTTKKNPFEDVDSNQYYYKAVLWAVEKGITNGTDKAHFSPKSTCTRGQIVTFLYRWKGSPKVEGAKNPFEDVKSGDFFYDAVLWAVANGITTGKNETHFAPKDTCTRAQVVTFMYRGK